LLLTYNYKKISFIRTISEAEGLNLGQANILARTLVNEPANLIGLLELAYEAKKTIKIHMCILMVF
jgi:leucyl aminopeptidase